MTSDFIPILFNTPNSYEQIEIYFAHDIHYGSAQFDNLKWEKIKQEIMSQPNRYVICVGDYCENAVVGSKSDIYTQVYPPHIQKEWLTNQFYELKDRIIAIVPGNHENNRITRVCGLYPVYDCAVSVGIQDRYRQHFAIVDIGVGNSKKRKNSQFRYFGYVTHKLKDCKNYCGSDFIEGIDFSVFGHDHAPKDQPRGKLVYDNKKKIVTQKDIETIDSGSCMTYGGYAVDNGYRPNSSKTYKLVCDGREKRITSVGYHL